MKMPFFVSLIICFLIQGYSYAYYPTIIETPQGMIQGEDKGDYIVYKGIPYAKPPVGNLRWKAPQPLPRWDGVFYANKFGPMCMQASLLSGKAIGEEDCLYLNIWVPKVQNPEKLPVMFWIHGGAFILGSGEQAVGPITFYDGEKLVREGKVILVSHNYRLGPLGFLAHSELKKESRTGTTGNYGILDQIAALKWVNKNISSFGGNPKNVTIFGESAGGSSVFVLLASPLTKGLFSAAIAQSGVFFDHVLEDDLLLGQRFTDHYGLSDHNKPMSVMRSLPAEQIVTDFPLEMHNAAEDNAVKYGNTVDGYVLKDTVLRTILKGEHNKVPVMIGSNANEMVTLEPLFLRSMKGINSAEYRELIKAFLKVSDTRAITRIYNNSRFGTHFNALKHLLEDSMFHAPVSLLSHALEAHNPGSVFTYHYSKSVLGLKAGHAAELFHLFGNEKLLAPLTFPNNILGYLTPSERDFSKMLRRYWTQFAHKHNPNSAENPTWPNFGKGQLLEIDKNPQVITVDQLDHHERLQTLEKILLENAKAPELDCNGALDRAS